MTESKTQESNVSWVKMKPEEIEKEIISLAKEGNTPAKIGLIMRDKHAVPKVKDITGKKLVKILKDNKIDFKDDAKQTEEKILYLEKHIRSNKHDRPAAKALTKQLWARRSLKE